MYSELWIKRDFISALLFKFNLPILAWKHSISVSRLSKEFEDVDVISAHWGYPHGLIATVLGEKFNKLSSVTYHGSDIHSLDNGVDKYALQSTQQTLINADINIFVSQSLEKFALKNVCKNKAIIKTAVLYNTIDTSTLLTRRVTK